MQLMPFVIGLKRIQLRVGVQNIFNRHHVLKAIGTTYGGVVFRSQRENLLVLVLGKEGAHGRVGEQDLWVEGGREGGG